MGQAHVALESFREQAEAMERIVYPQGDSEVPFLTLSIAISHAQEIAADATCDMRCRMDHQQLAEWLVELQVWQKLGRRYGYEYGGGHIHADGAGTNII